MHVPDELELDASNFQKYPSSAKSLFQQSMEGSSLQSGTEDVIDHLLHYTYNGKKGTDPLCWGRENEKRFTNISIMAGVSYTCNTSVIC